MNYPVWNVPGIGAGLVVAIIATIHVLISHFAIGGGAFLAVAEFWSDRQADGERIRAWLHKFATFFLVFTTVFGAVTGVGIWFSIQLASPEATSLLIHQFVFAWATEWIVFLAELSVLYLYYYGWKTNSRSFQRFLAAAYFVIAWFSLFVINGILTFMLTPGSWTLQNHDIAGAFFNPGFWPALFIRTAVMMLIAGLGAMLVASRLHDDALKARIVSFSAKWVIPAALLVPLFGYWYWSTLPGSSIDLFQSGATGVGGGKMASINRFFWLSVISGGLIMVSTMVIALRPKALHTTTAVALMLLALFGVVGAEFFREMARKPYVIKDTLYSNALWVHDATPDNLAQPYFSASRWEPETQPLSLEHGEWVYRLQCATCHTLNGYRGLKGYTAQWTPVSGVRFLETLEAQGVMPPFQGNVDDRAALTSFLLSLDPERAIAGSDVKILYEQSQEVQQAPQAALPFVGSLLLAAERGAHGAKEGLR